MRKWTTCFFILITLTIFNSQAKVGNPLVWDSLATLNVEVIEQRAKTHLFQKMPELKGLEIKLVQINAQYNKINAPILEIAFLHQNSFKPMEQNQTLGSIGDNYGIKHYMEFVFVEFSQKGEPINIRLNEVLLSGGKASFLETYNSF